ncbi:MAG: helix-turn-helix transcriptional regulator [Bacteriovorax sp.]|nr:helix-turn-helix transcriptional regulator [Bacteriovorax sp.]
MVEFSKLSINSCTCRILYKLKLYRELANVSQGQISQLLCISLRTYQRLEAGQAPLDICTILKIAQILNLTLAEWLSVDEPDPNPSVVCVESLEKFSLTKEDLEMVDLFNRIQSQDDFYNLSSTIEFKSSTHKFYLSCNTKKIANDKVLSEFEIGKTSKITDGYENPQKILHYLDYLFYFRPQYTFIKKVGLLSKNGNSYIAISIHKYIESNLFILSLLREGADD